MSRKLVKIALGAFLVLMQAGASAEDIDLFRGALAGDSNVLLIIDNSANFSANAATCTYPDDGEAPSMNGSIGGLEQCALYATIRNLKASDSLKIGLMAFNFSSMVDWQGNTCQSSGDGGCLMVPAMPMTAANKALLLAWIKTWDDAYKIKANKASTGAVMQEAWAYFAGRTGLSGRSYADMSPSTDCGKNYVIYVSGTAKTPNDSTGDPGPKNALEGTNADPLKNAFPAATTAQKSIFMGPVTTMCGTLKTFSGTNHENDGFYADEWARYMAAEDTTAITTYTIGVYDTIKFCSPITAGLLSSMATFGNTEGYLVTNAKEMQAAFEKALSEIQSINSAFASASLPVSVNAQGTYLNQIFIGMFRPEENPRWYGNLKQYQFVAEYDDDGVVVGLKTADKNGLSIVNPLSGFVTPCAESFWSADDAYWPEGYQGNCVGKDASSNLPDGEIVEKGGVAQGLRALADESARTVKTCNAGCGALADFNTSNSAITAELLTPVTVPATPTISSSERDAIINWARGQNLDGETLRGKGEDGKPIYVTYPTSTMRPSVHGDVVHSRPLAVDYGGNIGVVVFYGGNDGMLRAINGNQTKAISGGFEAGAELWSFVAPEHYGEFDRLRSNSVAVSFPDFVVGEDDPTPQPKDYFFDGPISVYSSASSKWIYASMRRGGSAVYAFDVSNPASPTLKWKRDGTDLTNIGQTWSEPKVAKVVGYFTEAIPATATTAEVPAKPKPLIIMGGGYDICEDLDAAPNATCATTKGNRVFVLDADTGGLKQTFTTERSVVADVTLRDSDGDGLVDIGYAVDTGANIYRINIGANAPEDWTMTKIAALGCDTEAACSRKFLHAPEVVVTAEYNAVLVGSGNRERPLLNNAATLVDNAFFMIKDDATDSSPDVITTSTTTTTGALALVEFDPNLEPTTAQLDELALSTNKGWYLAFGTQHSTPDLDHDKEQVVTSAIVFAGVAYFSTHTPTAPTTCGAKLGKARGYAVKFLNASSRDVGSKYSNFAGGGLAPSPVAGIVEITSTDEDGSTSTAKVPFIIGGKPSDGNIGSGIGGALLDVIVAPVRSRVYWYIQQ